MRKWKSAAKSKNWVHSDIGQALIRKLPINLMSKIEMVMKFDKTHKIFRQNSLTFNLVLTAF